MNEPIKKVSDPRLECVFHRVRSRAITALGVLVGTDSAVFYTSSDVAVKLIETAGVSIDSVNSEDFRIVTSAVSMALGNSVRKNLDNVRRTRSRIASKFGKGNAGFGYRIGMSLGTELVNEDTIRESKSNMLAFENLQKNKCNTAERLVNMMSFRELSDLELIIQVRKEQLYHSLERKMLEAKSALHHRLMTSESSSLTIDEE